MPTDIDLEPAYVPDDRFITEVRSRVDRRRRRRRRAVTSVATALLVLGGVGVWYADHRLSSIDRIEIGPTAADDPIATGAPINVLVIGTDACQPKSADDQVCSPLRQETGYADAIAVVRFDPSTNRTQVLNLPRDLMLTPTQRIAYRSVPDIRAVVSDRFGINIDHAVVLDMDGFARIGDALSLRLDFEQPVRDPNTGLDLAAGCQVLDGDQLLALVRSRHFQYQELNGGWKFDPTSDLGRIHRRATLIAAVLTQLGDQGAGSLSTIDTVVGELEATGAVDEGLSNSELLDLARVALRSEHTEVLTVPVAAAPIDSTVNGLGVTPGPQLDEMLARFGGRFTATPDQPLGSVLPPVDGYMAVGWTGFTTC